jgi:hypothetical protein
MWFMFNMPFLLVDISNVTHTHCRIYLKRYCIVSSWLLYESDNTDYWKTMTCLLEAVLVYCIDSQLPGSNLLAISVRALTHPEVGQPENSGLE